MLQSCGSRHKQIEIQLHQIDLLKLEGYYRSKNMEKEADSCWALYKELNIEYNKEVEKQRSKDQQELLEKYSVK